MTATELCELRRLCQRIPDGERFRQIHEAGDGTIRIRSLRSALREHIARLRSKIRNYPSARGGDGEKNRGKLTLAACPDGRRC